MYLLQRLQRNLFSDRSNGADPARYCRSRAICHLHANSTLSGRNNKLCFKLCRNNEYIPSTKVITAFTTVNDIRRKTLEELKELAALGYNDLYVGTETGSPDILAWIKKGHTLQDALEQLHRLENTSIRYSVQYITGLAGSGNGVKNAVESAEFFNQIHPYMIGSSSLTIFPDTELGNAFAHGTFTEASELERIEEMRVLIDHIKRNAYYRI